MEYLGGVFLLFSCTCVQYVVLILSCSYYTVSYVCIDCQVVDSYLKVAPVSSGLTMLNSCL